MLLLSCERDPASWTRGYARVGFPWSWRRCRARRGHVGVAGVGIGAHELHPGQSVSVEAAEELVPERNLAAREVVQPDSLSIVDVAEIVVAEVNVT